MSAELVASLRQSATSDQENQGKAGKGKKSQAVPEDVVSGVYRLPEPDRTVQVSLPALLPPVLEEEEEEEEEEEHAHHDDFAYQTSLHAALPKKLPLSHLSLLKRPVVIEAIDNFMTDQECRAWIEWGERKGFEEAKQKQNSTYAFRDNGRIEVSSPDTAYQIWLRMRPFVPEEVGSPPRKVLGCSPRIRLYRYREGQRFGKHVDGSRDEPGMGGRTHFTVLVYLNGGDRDLPDLRVRGGETVFWEDHGGRKAALAFPPTRGVCLYHGHGDECMTHEGAYVQSGEKYVLRTDVVYELEKS